MPKKDLGDFQTPLDLVAAIIDVLQGKGKSWTRVLEPTCGRGNFLAGMSRIQPLPAEMQGIEIQATYVQQARERIKDEFEHVTIHQRSIFDMQLGRDLHWRGSGPLLVIGNPPWVTNSALTTLGSDNVPLKTNYKRQRGLDAITGAANFDIAEFIWMKLIRELADQEPTIALLCKTTVARQILLHAAQVHLPISNMALYMIDAKRWFGAAVDACMCILDVRASDARYVAQVYDRLDAPNPSSRVRVVGNRLMTEKSDRPFSASLDGTSPLTWRQGIKHDAASVVELTKNTQGGFVNKSGEVVPVEQEYIYPLLKGSGIGGANRSREERAVLVPYRHIGKESLDLQKIAPNLWAYLADHQDAFARRKSVVYRNQAPFAYFGIGEYSFAPYKVAVSGMYKTPHFKLITPVGGKPVMLDDTCYFVPCASYAQGLLLVTLLNHPLCQEFIRSILFTDAKRPITKKLLQRIDLLKLLHALAISELQALATQMPEYTEVLIPDCDSGSRNRWRALLLTGTAQPHTIQQLVLL
jgi:hypothetical protein